MNENFDTLSIDEKISVALETGNWMVRVSQNGSAYGGFKWNGIGEWTIAVDWNDSPVCGGGLHGSALEGWGYFSRYSQDARFEFCATEGERVVIDDDKIKVRKAMILAVGNDALAAICDIVYHLWS